MTIDELKAEIIRVQTERMTIAELLFHASSSLWFKIEKADENTLLAMASDEKMDALIQRFKFEKEQEEKSANGKAKK